MQPTPSPSPAPSPEEQPLDQASPTGGDAGRREPIVVPTVPIPGAEDVGVATLTAEEPAEEVELRTAASLWAVVLAGGIGSRFWPLSSPERPKQLLSLVGDRPLIADTVSRLAPLVPP